MTVLDRLGDHAGDTETLDKFLSNNTLAFIDWFNKLPYPELLTLSEPLTKFARMKVPVWRALPPTGYNLAFLTFLLEKMEQLGEVSSFRRIYAELSKIGANIGSRLNAAGLYLVDTPAGAEDYLNRFEAIYELLAEAVRNEDDGPNKALATIIHYYLMAIESFGEFNPKIPVNLHDNLVGIMSRDPNSFLRCQLMYDVLSVGLNDAAVAADHIRKLLDEYLNRDEPVLGIETGILVEKGTHYCDLLEPVDADFDSIRQISVRLHMDNPDKDEVRASLNRGVAIIDREEQLWCYMHSYGNMHSAKLRSAFEHVPFDQVEPPVRVVDWGCGQGTATMMLFDYIEKQGIDLDINTVILIEPSDLALRRGGLHSFKFDDSTELKTLNKKLGDVETTDFTSSEGTTIHLFSNILDVGDVALLDLSNLVKASFPGPNVFVCVSPYIYGKTIRFDSFMNGFVRFNLIKLFEVDQAKGKWIGEWTRTIRVFTTEF